MIWTLIGKEYKTVFDRPYNFFLVLSNVTFSVRSRSHFASYIKYLRSRKSKDAFVKLFVIFYVAMRSHKCTDLVKDLNENSRK